MSDRLPRSLSLETIPRKRWVVSTMIQHGARHIHANEPLQDDLTVGGHGDDVTWLVLADGVSSEPLSHHGARLSCAAVAQHLDDAQSKTPAAGSAAMLAAFGAAHDALAAAARSAKQPIESYSCTLAAVLLNGPAIVAASIGDSAIVAYSRHRDGTGHRSRITPFASAPQPPERGTYTITHPEWRRLVTVRESHSPHIQALVLATDGTNSFFQADGTEDGSAYDTFYLDQVGPTLEQLKPRLFPNFFANYALHREADKNDDRTIILAWRLDGEASDA